MKLFRFSFLSLFVFFSLVLSAPAFAVTDTATIKVVVPKTTTEAIILAEVNIQDARIISQEGNVFKISFNLTNGKGLQTGVKYGIKLVSITPKSQTIVDEVIYPEALTLYENKTIQKEITYIAPIVLDGVYKLFLTSRNESGFPFSTAFVKEVKLVATVKGLEILPSSCSLSVVGEKGAPTYKLNQVVDIAPTESLSLTCSVINGSNTPIEAVPTFTTTEGTVYGKVAITDTGDINPISFKANESKTFSVLLPKATSAGIYYLTTGLKQADTLSNTISFSYIIRGNIASIKNLFMDKDYYQKGDTANLSFMWNTLGGKLLRGNTTKDSSSSVSVAVTASMVDYRGKECSAPITKALVQDFTKPKTELPISITRDCFNPTVTVTLKDSAGVTLDEKSFNIETLSVKKPAPYTLYIIALLIIIIGTSIYMKRKNKTGTDGNIPPEKTGSSIPLNIIFPFLLLVAFGLVPVHKVKADTFWLYSGGCSVLGTVGLSSSEYWAGSDVTANGSFSDLTNCPYAGVFLSIIASDDPVMTIIYQKTVVSYYGSGTATFKAPITGQTDASVTFFGELTTPAGGYVVSPYFNFPYTIKKTSMDLIPYPSSSIPYGGTTNIIWMMSPTFDFFGPTIVSCFPSSANGYSSDPSGTFTTPPLYTSTTYIISCLDSNGFEALGSTTITVAAPPAPTVNLLINGSKDQSVDYNGSAAVKWNATNATLGCTCNFSPPNGDGITSCGSSASNATDFVGLTIYKLQEPTEFIVTCNN